MQLYEYRALPTDRITIRLIRLNTRASQHLPASSPDLEVPPDASREKGPMPPADLASSTSPPKDHGQIFHTPIAEAPAYAALSYVWGDPELDRVTACFGGALLSISSNLHSALQHIADTHGPLILWADALCINQDDPVEKASQIGHMGEIYSRAERVLSWLGPAADDSDEAMRWIADFGSRANRVGVGTKRHLRSREMVRTFRTNPGTMSSGARELASDLLAYLGSQSDNTRQVRRALTRFFERPYWRRIWVVQEVALGAENEFLCGKMRVSDMDLRYAVRLVHHWSTVESDSALERPVDETVDYSGDDGSFPTHKIPVQSTINILGVRPARGPFDIATLLCKFRMFEATDRKDMVFGLLGLESDAKGLGIRPNYLSSVSWQDVFTDVTARLYSLGYLDLLAHCSHYSETEPSSGLPSWVPNFGRKTRGSPLQARTTLPHPKRTPNGPRSFLQPSYATSGLGPHQPPVFSRMDGPRAAMTIGAVCLGQISHHGTPWNVCHLDKWLVDLKHLARPLFPNSAWGGPECMEAVFRTAVADVGQWQDSSGKPRLSSELVQKLIDLIPRLDLVDQDKLLELGLGDYLRDLRLVGEQRRPFLANHRIGIGPSTLQEGDAVYILMGATVPYVLRRGDKGQLRLVGEAFVHGVMDGEALADSTQFESITIY